MLQTIQDLDTKISSYTEDSTTEKRSRVIDVTNNNYGIVVSHDISDPDSKSKEKGCMVKWQKTGEMKWYSKKSLENINSQVKLISPSVVDFLVNFISY